MKRKTIKQLEYELSVMHEQRDFFQKLARKTLKRKEALANGIRRVHPEDKSYMMNFKTDDPELFDVYNEFLYSFCRPDERGVCFTRIGGCW